MTYYFNGTTSAITSVTTVATNTTVGGLNFGFYMETTEVGKPTEWIRVKGFITGFGAGRDWEFNQVHCQVPNYFMIRVRDGRMNLEVSDSGSPFYCIARLKVQVNLPNMILAVWKSTSPVDTGVSDITKRFFPILACPTLIIGTCGQSSSYTGYDLTFVTSENELVMHDIVANADSNSIAAKPVLRNYEVEDDRKIQVMTQAVSSQAIKEVIARSGFITR